MMPSCLGSPFVAGFDPAISACYGDLDLPAAAAQPAQNGAVGKVCVGGIEDILGDVDRRRANPVFDDAANGARARKDARIRLAVRWSPDEI